MVSGLPCGCRIPLVCLPIYIFTSHLSQPCFHIWVRPEYSCSLPLGFDVGSAHFTNHLPTNGLGMGGHRYKVSVHGAGECGLIDCSAGGLRYLPSYLRTGQYHFLRFGLGWVVSSRHGTERTGPERFIYFARGIVVFFCRLSFSQSSCFLLR